jgi:hypothetical protein
MQTERIPDVVIDGNKSKVRVRELRIAAGTETGQYSCLSGPMSGRIRDHPKDCQVVQMADPTS